MDVIQQDMSQVLVGVAMQHIRKFVFTATLVAVFFGLAPGVPMGEAEAGWLKDLIHRIRASRQARQAAPELDPGTAGQAMVVLAGGAYLIAGRRRKNV